MVDHTPQTPGSGPGTNYMIIMSSSIFAALLAGILIGYSFRYFNISRCKKKRKDNERDAGEGEVMALTRTDNGDSQEGAYESISGIPVDIRHGQVLACKKIEVPEASYVSLVVLRNDRRHREGRDGHPGAPDDDDPDREVSHRERGDDHHAPSRSKRREVSDTGGPVLDKRMQSREPGQADDYDYPLHKFKKGQERHGQEKTRDKGRKVVAGTSRPPAPPAKGPPSDRDSYMKPESKDGSTSSGSSPGGYRQLENPDPTLPSGPYQQLYPPGQGPPGREHHGHLYDDFGRLIESDYSNGHQTALLAGEVDAAVEVLKAGKTRKDYLELSTS